MFVGIDNIPYQHSFNSDSAQDFELNLLVSNNLGLKNPQSDQNQADLPEFWENKLMNSSSIIDLANYPSLSIIDSTKVLIKNVCYKLVPFSSRFRVSIEAFLRSSLRHPNIVPVEFRVTIDQLQYIAQPIHLQLREFRLHKTGNWVDMLIQIGNVLVFLTSKGILTSHLNPENVFVDEQRNILISELVQVSQRQAKYTAPEVLFGQGFNEKSYCWTFACLIVFLFTGNDPFQDLPEQEERFKYAVLNGKAVKALLRHEEVGIVKEILKKAFKFNCNKRPTLIDMMRQLDKYS